MKKYIDVILFGEFSLTYNGNVLAEKDYRSQKMWAVLAYLIMNRQRPVTQSELIQRFWDDEEGQNPNNALKTLIFRLRKLLISLVGEEIQPIISTLGAYQWSSQLPCRVDVEKFEGLIHKCETMELSEEEQMSCYQQVLDLYRGDFLPKAINLSWHTMRSAYYHMKYSQAACAYAQLLEAKGKHEELTRVCGHTLHQGVLEEKLYVMMIRGLLHQGNHTQALRQYEKATEVLYNELGVSRPTELNDLYQEIMDESLKQESDIGAILKDMEDNREPEAFFCEYGIFKAAYCMEKRRNQLNGTCSHMVLVTLVPAQGKSLTREVQSHAMKALKKSMSASLRMIDVVSQYSNRQYVILLPSADYETSENICQRLEDTFHKNWYNRMAKLHCVIRRVDQSN